jgi:FMN phosphatase YigB (HAD superfamily)
MRIAVDIDSTLHDYWEVLSEISVRRFGVELPYEEQLTWGLTRLRPEQLALCVKESHSEERILAGVPYPGAVEAVRDWRERGHAVYVASNREADCHDATAAWLDAIGLPFDGLLCCSQKLERCLELGVELLIDDSPMSIAGALERGLLAATITHPWNEEVCEEEDVICAHDWHELARLLAPVVEGAPHAAARPASEAA